ncbi:hypothetical protein BDU57DRAFT_537630 [Ampelomyces quisqualis]|uniref:RING-type domain-containing protein n=1 Tax=Ampelomyces quisqualis TaxID=50730 RepID=A0A6A5QT40_AMPQU|nr:hypothetical protein BDU57DRAFT_537630 [Ampelomyces quisqualis]
MSALNSLPTKTDFMANHIEKLETCGICYEPFDATHVATRIQGLKCQHIFGWTCLNKWLNSNAEQSNTCPMCREVLFVKPPPKKRCICTITNVEHAWEYVFQLRDVCQILQNADRTWLDLTLAQKLITIMNVTAVYTATPYAADFPGGLKLTERHREVVRPIVEAMLLMPREDPSCIATRAEMRDRTPLSINAAWFSLLSRALGWDFSETHGP